VRPHARGGLGEVFVAYDEELHREVALKEIQPRYADYADSRARFLLEAEVTGRLEHPGVVPVYGLGSHPDGRPFYAMRFIKGDTLKDAVDRFHRAEVRGRDPGERALALRELLGRFVAVCNAVAYAHSRGVLHRDLKPANVMLGPYGETLLVDWGLAKVMGRREEAARTAAAPLNPRAAGGLSPTVVGTMMGTPGYVSPEQAVGEVDSVGPASDIYSLGATLYHLLTGRAPRDRKDVLEVPRGMPRPLQAVCRKAMALHPEDRYGTALALAADVEHWLADEPVSAHREPWSTRGRRWMRRHKPAVAAATATVLAVALLGGGGALWLARHQAERRAEQARQEERQRQEASAALDKLPDLMRQWRWKEAETVLGEADRRLGETGPADLRGRAAQGRADLNLAMRLEAIRLRRATMIEGKFEHKTADRSYAAEFQESGLGREGEEVEALAAHINDSAIKDQLVAALDDWTAARIAETDDPERAAWVLRVARAADRDSWRNRVRDPKVWRDRAALEGLADELLKDEAMLLKAQSPQFLATLGAALHWSYGDELPLLTEAQRRYPSDFWLNFNLGNALCTAKQWHKAVGYYRAALVVRPQASAVFNNLGLALGKMKELDEEIREYRTAIDLDPKDARAHYNLGNALGAKGQLDAAIQEYKTAIDLDPKLAQPHNNLGIALKDKKQLDEAIREFKTAVDLDPKLVQAHNNLGAALADNKQLDAAIGEFKTSIDLDPKDAAAHNGLGTALRAKGQLDAAIQEYKTAIDLDPKLAQPHYNLGNALMAKGRLDEAIQEYKTAIDLDPKDARAHSNLGDALGAKGQLDAAIGEYKTAIDLDPTIAVPRNNLGRILWAKGRLEEAAQEFKTVIDLDRTDATAHYNLGALLLEQGQFVEARSAMRRVLELLADGSPLKKLANEQLQRCERLVALDEKLPAILEGKAKPADTAEHVALSWLCQLPHKRLYAASARFYAEALEAQPELAKNPANGIRNTAACAAALAGCGKGEDAAMLDEKQRARLRRQALDWLNADLALWAKLADNNDPKVREAVQLQMKHWQADAALAGLRDKDALGNLPEAERGACQKLWAEVEALRKKCGG
jgi:tetratricopeptide (TPR) repeat protein/tRNA A-37 threonylcarbamoyl transferase component Bud32